MTQAYYADYIYYDSKAYIDSWLITNEGKVTGVQANAPIEADKHVFRESAIFPAFINTHTHLPMTFFRGYADDMPLEEWLTKHIWPLEQKWLSPEFVRDASYLAAAELIHSGTACANDMYFMTSSIISVFNKAGLRGLFGCGIIDVPGKRTKTEDFFDRVLELADENKDNPLINITLCPHAPYTVTPETYKQLVSFAQKHDFILHTHLAETAKEFHDITNKYGKSPAILMDSVGAFDCNSIFAHCVHLSDADIELMGKKNANIAHCLQSNLKLASGFAPIDRLMKSGANITIGTDSCASNNDQNLLAELSSVALFHKAFSQDPTVLNAKEAFKCATENAAKALRLPTGNLIEGAPADFMVVSYSKAHMQPVYDHLSHLIYTASKEDITDLYVAGRPLMQAGEIITFDENEVIEKARQWSKKIKGSK